jgi:hypothetical protein
MDDSEESPCPEVTSDESPYETIEESVETPGFVAPAATVERPYETIEESEESPCPEVTSEESP